MTFFLEIADNNVYSRIMEGLISRSLTHSKDSMSSGYRLEVQGNLEDYKFFEKLISDMNASRPHPAARIIEGV
jgi:hypothetical protein